MDRLDKLLNDIQTEIVQISDQRKGLTDAGAIPDPSQISQVVVSLKIAPTGEDGPNLSALNLIADPTQEILALVAQGVQKSTDLKKAEILTRLNKIIALAGQAKSEWLNPAPLLSEEEVSEQS